jgi:hypothetical protein
MTSTNVRSWQFRLIRHASDLQTADLYLYPELDGSSVVEDYYDLDGAGQLEAYVRYVRERHPEWLADDAVPIYWTVQSAGGKKITETAPFQDSPADEFRRHLTRNFLTYFTWPQDAGTGERLDWYRLPVRNDRFPEFAKALAWLPSPLQPTCPLRSILESRAGHSPRLAAWLAADRPPRE